MDQAVPSAECWWRLPAETRAQVLTLLARLIARGVIAEQMTPETAGGAGGAGAGRG